MSTPEGQVPSLVVRRRAEYDTWCLAALVKEEALIKTFIDYWEKRNPALALQGDKQLGWVWQAKRRAA